MSAVQGESPGPDVPTGTSPRERIEAAMPHDEAELAIDLDLTQELIADAEAKLLPAQPANAEPELSKAERLRVDHLVVKMVIDEGLNGPRENYLLQQLVRYAQPVLKVMLSDGRIFAKCRRLRRPVEDDISFLDLSDQDRNEIVQDMISDALPVFRKNVFEQDRWSPDKGASLKTYFVNACALQFPGIYRKWKESRRWLTPLEDEHSNIPITRGSEDPARRVIVHDKLRQALDSVPVEIRKALDKYAEGFTMEEAAERSGITPKKLEGAVARLRKKNAAKKARRPGAGEGQC